MSDPSWPETVGVLITILFPAGFVLLAGAGFHFALDTATYMMVLLILFGTVMGDSNAE